MKKMGRRKVCLFFCLSLLFTPIILLSQIDSELYKDQSGKFLIDSNKYQPPTFSSLSDVYNALHKSLEKNQQSSKTQLLLESYLEQNKIIDNLYDSCNALIKFGKDLRDNAQYADALILFSYMHSYFQTKKIEKKEDYLIFANIKLNTGRIYSEMRMWVKALGYLNDAFNISKTQNDQNGMAYALNNIGSIYIDRGDFSKAKKYINASININQQLKLKKNLFWDYNSFAVIYIYQENYSAALDYYYKALNQLDTKEDSTALATIYINLSDVYIKTNKLREALHYIDLAKVYSHTKTRQLYLYANNIEIFDKLDMNDSSSKYLENVFILLKNTENPYYKQLAYKIAYKHYETNNNFELAYSYSLKHKSVRDSIDHINNQQTSSLINNLNNIYEIELENSLLKQKLTFEKTKTTQNIIWFIGISSILLITLTLFVLLLRSRKREFKILNKNADINEELIQQEKQILLQNENELTKEIEYRNRQLTSTTLQLSHYNQYILKTIKELQSVLLTFKSYESSKRKHIQTVINDLRQFTSGNNWEEFRLFFEEVHPSFYKKIYESFPKLTQNELKLCALIKLGLSNKDIASIIFRELRSIESARNRLRKKFNLNADNTLFDFLSGF